jgi:hypothetical protein
MTSLIIYDGSFTAGSCHLHYRNSLWVADPIAKIFSIIGIQGRGPAWVGPRKRSMDFSLPVLHMRAVCLLSDDMLQSRANQL